MRCACSEDDVRAHPSSTAGFLSVRKSGDIGKKGCEMLCACVHTVQLMFAHTPVGKAGVSLSAAEWSHPLSELGRRPGAKFCVAKIMSRTPTSEAGFPSLPQRE